jgi:hypothetical protein
VPSGVIGQLDPVKVEVGLDGDVAAFRAAMHKRANATKIERLATGPRPMGIQVPFAQHLAQVVQGVRHAALAAAVGAEEQRDWAEFDALALAEGLEVLDLDGG